MDFHSTIIITLIIIDHMQQKIVSDSMEPVSWSRGDLSLGFSCTSAPVVSSCQSLRGLEIHGGLSLEGRGGCHRPGGGASLSLAPRLSDYCR